MSVFGVAMVKDEADIIEPVVRHMAAQVDRLIVADNGSTDGTREILQELARVLPLDVLDDPDPGYYQSEKMTRLARQAGEGGASWVVPFDADELWYSPFGRIGDVLTGLDDHHVAGAALYDHVATAVDPSVGDPIARMGWRRVEPAPLPKVACRPTSPVVIAQGNHDAQHPSLRVDGQLVVRHFPYRSPAQMIRKVRNGAAAYAATDLPVDHGAHWRQYGALLESGGEAAIAGVFREWFWAQDPTTDASLIYDPAPLS